MTADAVPTAGAAATPGLASGPALCRMQAGAAGRPAES